MSKELVRLKRRKKATIIVLALGCVFAFLSNGATIASFIAISFLGTMVGANVIQNNVEDRLLNFRGTFKLMGLIDEAYIIGNFLFQFCIAMSINFCFIITALLFNGGDFGAFMNIQYFSFYFINVVLFTISNMMVCYAFASLIKDGKSVKAIANMFTGIISVVPMFFALKYWIGNAALQNSGSLALLN